MVNKKEGLVKTISTRSVFIIKDTNNKEWIAWLSQTGDVVLIHAESGSYYHYPFAGAGNIYPKVATIQDGKIVLYATSGGYYDLTVVDGNNGVPTNFKVRHLVNGYSNYGRMASIRSGHELQNIISSDDGNLYFDTFRYRDVHGTIKFNPTTGAAEELNMLPLPSVSNAQARIDIGCWKLEGNVLFEGVYVDYPYDSNGDFFLSTLLSEIESTELSFIFNQSILLHWDDRNPTSLKRRIITNINGSTHVLDLKDLSEWIAGNTSVNHGFARASNTVNLNSQVWSNKNGDILTLTWTKGNFPVFAAELGEQVPSIDMSIHYHKQFKWGKIIFQGFTYAANKDYFFVYAKDATTGNVIWIPQFSPYTNFANNGVDFRRAAVNFGGALYGYDAGDNNVGFLKNELGNWGFVRLDNNEFFEYDFNVNSSSYSIEILDPNNPTHPSFIGQGGFISQVIEELGDGQMYYVSALYSGQKLKPALLDEIVVKITGKSSADLTLEVVPDYQDTDGRYKIDIKNLSVTNGSLGSVIQLENDKVAIAGIIYSGILVYDYENNVFEFNEESAIRHGDVISIRGASKLSSGDVFYYGYLGKSQLLQNSNYDLLDIPAKVIGRGEGVAETDGYVFIYGPLVRNLAYRNYARISYIDLSTNINLEFPDVPFWLDYNAAINIRTQLNMVNSSYSLDATEKSLTSYEIASGTTRANTIDLLKTCPAHRINSIVSYQSGIDWVVILGQLRTGYASMQGLQLFDVDGETVIGASVDNEVSYPQLVAYTGDLNPANSIDTDWKRINITAEVIGMIDIGRAYATNNYIVFLKNNETGGKVDYTANGGETALSTSRVYDNDDFLVITKNGVILEENIGWTRTSGTDTMTLADVASENDIYRTEIFDKAEIRIISKSAMDSAIAAGEITSWTKTLHINLGAYGFTSPTGFGIGGNNPSSTQGNNFVSNNGDVLYVSIKPATTSLTLKDEDGDFVRVISIDLSEANIDYVEVAKMDSTLHNLVLSYYSPQSNLWVGKATDTIKINLSTATFPVDIS